MKRTTALAIVSALLLPLAARAQSTPQTAPQSAQQPAKPYSSLDDDPQFKRLSPEQQELVRKMMASVDKAVAAEQNKPGATPKAAPPNPASNAQPGCTALPVKKPRFHIPKAVQDAINKGTKQIGSKTGVALDPNAPAQTVNDAQKDAQGKPCPASPAPAPKPANQ
jgi:hypothetical protein